MFYAVFFIIALYISYASSAYFFELRRNGKVLSLKNKLSLCLIHILPFANLSALVIKSINVQDDIKVLLIAIGSLLCLFIILMAEGQKYPSK